MSRESVLHSLSHAWNSSQLRCSHDRILQAKTFLCLILIFVSLCDSFGDQKRKRKRRWQRRGKRINLVWVWNGKGIYSRTERWRININAFEFLGTWRIEGPKGWWRFVKNQGDASVLLSGRFAWFLSISCQYFFKRLFFPYNRHTWNRQLLFRWIGMSGYQWITKVAFTLFFFLFYL